jgi:hypothetical protein
MKRLISLIPMLILTSCAWIAANPQLDTEAVGLVEQGIEDVYQYESGRTLSPTPPQPNAVPQPNPKFQPTRQPGAK